MSRFKLLILCFTCHHRLSRALQSIQSITLGEIAGVFGPLFLFPSMAMEGFPTHSGIRFQVDSDCTWQRLVAVHQMTIHEITMQKICFCCSIEKWKN